MNRYLHGIARRTQHRYVGNAVASRVLRGTLLCGLAGLSLPLASACAPPIGSARTAPVPIVGRWPEPAFAPDQQCRGRHSAEALAGYLPRARLALWLPSTRRVSLDPARRCITVTVSSVGGARLAELIMRGVAVPRRAVLLILTGAERA
jgi:hypothetical protein